MPSTTLLVLASAVALQPPVGWTQLGPDRAVLVPADPGRGELREIDLPGSDTGPQRLADALAAQGIPARIAGTVADGSVNLDLGTDLVGRARAWTGAGGVTWYVVLAARSAAHQLDAAALLAALLPRAGIVGGDVTVLEAGGDGTPWDVTATGPAEPSRALGPWSSAPARADGDWAPNASLVGVWGGNTEGLWGGREMVLTLDVTGRLRIEERGAEGVRVTEGTWGARGAQLRLAPFTGSAVTTAYALDAQSLGFVWGGRAVTLARRR